MFEYPWVGTIFGLISFWVLWRVLKITERLESYWNEQDDWDE